MKVGNPVEAAARVEAVAAMEDPRQPKLYDRTRLRKDLKARAAELKQLERYVRDVEQAHLETLESRSWRLLAPLRALVRSLRRQRYESFEPRYLGTARAKPSGGKRLGTDRDQMQIVRNYLWVGHADRAEADLAAMIADGTRDPRSRFAAVTELAAWLDFSGRSAAAWDLLAGSERLASEAGRGARRLMRMGTLALRDCRRDEARRLYAAARPNGFDADLALLQANTDDDDEGRLALINKTFGRHGLAPLRKADRDARLAFGNLTADPPTAPVPDQGKVSVIMPIFEAEATVGVAVRSLLAQTYRNLEILLVDDCSGDGTGAALQDLAASDRRVRVLRMPVNGGPYRARNLGLAEATGCFITTHDADDWSHPQKIACQMERFARYPDLLANSTHWARATFDLRFTTGWRLSDRVIVWNHSSFLFRREVIDLLGGWDPVRVSGDTEFIWRVENAFGPSAVRRSLPDVALSFGLDSEESLTRHKASHVSTIYAGLRFYYREISRYWHTREVVPTGSESRTRKLAMIPSALRFRNGEERPVDQILAGDCAHPGVVAKMKLTALAADRRFGVAHMPDYDLSVMRNFEGRQLCDEFFELLGLPNVRIALPDEIERAGDVLAIAPDTPLVAVPAAFVPDRETGMALRRLVERSGVSGPVVVVGAPGWAASVGLDVDHEVFADQTEAALDEMAAEAPALVFAEGLPEGRLGQRLATAALERAALTLVVAPAGRSVVCKLAGALTAEEWAVECFRRPPEWRFRIEDPCRPASGRATVLAFR